MDQVKAARAIILAECDENGIGDKVRTMEARLAQMFIQQPTEEDLAALATAFALVGMQAEALMANAHPRVKSGDTEPSPIEVQLQPTDAQVEEGQKALWEQIPGALDSLYEQMGEDEVKELLSDTVVFMWQGMIGARNK
ncbi:hypothetical protein sortkaff_56 [Escherichia phage sortkaff]|uniref:Uncharacterized protein n=1 Tax=Escherichia phage sortkaff TaxID=2696445 RepID=A0A6C0R2C4_9CAUD|nr:hypothetical protein sortkaff_56 [Escherichia phage sortkaff]